MKLKDIGKEELELMSYSDIAYKILEETKKKMKVTDLFRTICDLLGLTEADYESQIADFFEILTTDKKFIMLENGYWDLRTRHSEKMVVEEDDDEQHERCQTEVTQRAERAVLHGLVTAATCRDAHLDEAQANESHDDARHHRGYYTTGILQYASHKNLHQRCCHT